VALSLLQHHLYKIKEGVEGKGLYKIKEQVKRKDTQKLFAILSACVVG